jgi:hypothetical protein
MLRGPTVVMRIGVVNNCVDEGAGPGKMPAVTMTYTDTATGTWQGASTYMASYGLYYYEFSAGSPVSPDQAAPTTLTVTVIRSNGKVQDSRSMTTAEVLQSVQSLQPAA